MDHGHLASAIGALLDAPNSASGDKCEHVDSYVVRRLAKGSRDRSDPRPAPVHPRSRIRVRGGIGLSSGDLRKGLRVAAYPDFGLFIYKSPRVYLAIRCGRGDVNQIGNHAHNDNLSFELALDGNLLVTDPGTYVYTPLPNMRNRFRSTAMHNTLVIDGREQNDWKEGREGLFSLRDRSKSESDCLSADSLSRRTLRIWLPPQTRVGSRKMASRHATNVRSKVQKVLFHVPPSLNVSFLGITPV